MGVGLLVFISQEFCIPGEVQVNKSQEGTKVRRDHTVWEVIVSVCALSPGPSETCGLSICIHLRERKHGPPGR